MPGRPMAIIVMGVPPAIEYVQTVMLLSEEHGGASPGNGEMAPLGTDKESGARYATLRLQQLCEEEHRCRPLGKATRARPTPAAPPAPLSLLYVSARRMDVPNQLLGRL